MLTTTAKSTIIPLLLYGALNASSERDRNFVCPSVRLPVTLDSKVKTAEHIT